jgi:uncharacterized protein
VVSLDEYLALREWPGGSPVMFQKWRDLTFLHVSTEPGQIQPLLPAGLQVDTFPDDRGRDRGWITLSPFRMFDVHIPGIPPIPGFDHFPETNLRTYVHRGGSRPGVWFFSLDIDSAVAAAAARLAYGLPYFDASMTCTAGDESATYTSRRSDASQASLDMTTAIGVGRPKAEPGTLEFFLIERYLLYGYQDGALVEGQVNHEPYPIREAMPAIATETIRAAAGLEECPWELFHFSPGVNVKVFAPKRLA